MKPIPVLILSVWFYGFLATPSTLAADQDRTILLDESRIIGESGAPRESGGRVPTERPALSTSIPWEGDEETLDPGRLDALLDRLDRPESGPSSEPARTSGEASANRQAVEKLR
jgi:hypothetical protein